MNSKRIYTLTCTWAESYGAVLQAYALAQAIDDLGFDAQIINYQPGYDLIRRSRRVLRPIYRPKFLDFLRESGLLTRSVYRDLGELKAADLPADALVVGSDQVWNCDKYFNGRDDAMFLEFARRGAKRVSYAASLSMAEVPPDQAERYKRLLDKFDAVSVREATGAKALSRLGIEDPRVMVDPVYLLDREHWGSLASKGARDFSTVGYVLVVCLEQRDAVYEYARAEADRRGVPLYSLTHGPRAFKKHARVDKNLREPSVYDYLGAISGADAVITDSFHAMSFSLIFNRDVKVVPRGDGGNSRMLDLLEDLGISDRVLSTAPASDERVDFTRVNRSIEDKAEGANDFLLAALAEEEARSG